MALEADGTFAVRSLMAAECPEEQVDQFDFSLIGFQEEVMRRFFARDGACVIVSTGICEELGSSPRVLGMVRAINTAEELHDGTHRCVPEIVDIVISPLVNEDAVREKLASLFVFPEIVHLLRERHPGLHEIAWSPSCSASEKAGGG